MDAGDKYKKAGAGAGVIFGIFQIMSGGSQVAALIGQLFARYYRRQFEKAHQHSDVHGLSQVATGRGQIDICYAPALEDKVFEPVKIARFDLTLENRGRARS